MSAKNGGVSSRRELLVNSSSRSIMSNNHSPSDFVRCFDRSYGHSDATGNPMHNHSCTNSAVIVLSSSSLVDSILYSLYCDMVLL